MSNAFLSSKIVVREESPGVRQFTAGPTAVLAMVGLTEKGPVASPLRFTTFEEWKFVYGSYSVLSRDTVANVQAFFEEGGADLWFSRTGHWIDINDESRGTTMLTATVNIGTLATTLTAASLLGNRVATFAIPGGSILKLHVDGAGGTVDIPFDEDTAASVNVVIAATVDLSIPGDEDIALEIDNAGSVAFSMGVDVPVVAIAAVTRAELVVGLNFAFPGTAVETGTGYTITSTTRGVTSEIDITLAAANTGMTVATTNGVDNDMNDATAVTIAEAVAAIDAASGIGAADSASKILITSDTTGASSGLLVNTVTDSVVADALGLSLAQANGTDLASAIDTLQVDAKYEGVYGNSVTVVITEADSAVVGEFNLEVFDDGFLVELYANQSQTIVDTTVNATDGSGSEFIATTVLTAARPGDTASPVVLIGGSDGDPVDDNDFIGVAGEDNGLHAFDDITGLTLLAIPARTTAVLQQEMLNFAAGRRFEVFVILDSPALQTAAGIVSYVTTNLIEGSSELGALYWPHVQVRNPNKTILGDTDNITIPPSGMIAGVYAKTDGARPGGVYDPPAGLEGGKLTTATGFEILPGKTRPESDAEAKRDLVYPHRINPLSISPGQRVIDGDKTLLATGNFPFVSQRRGASNIEKVVRQGLEFARFQNNNAELRAEVHRSIQSFLLDQMALGAFASTTPDEAFLIDVGEGLNNKAVVAQGILRVRMGLAMATPAEFIDIIVSRNVLSNE